MAMEIFKLVGRITYEGQRTVEQGLTRLNTKINEANTKLKEFGKTAQDIGDKTKEIGEGLSTKVAAPLAAIGGGALVAATQVNDAQTRIQNSLGLSTKEAQELTTVARNIYKNGFGESLGEVQDALIRTRQNIQGLNNEQLQDVTTQALVLADTFDSDVNEVTRAGGNIMQGFGVDSTKAFDLMAYGAQNGLNFSNEMFDNLAEYSPLFAKMGYSADEYFQLLIQGGSEAVYNLDYVNDIMKEFQIRLKDGSKTTSEAMGQLSGSTQKVWQSYLEGDATVKDVSNTVIKELQGMDDQTAANNIAVGLFGTKFEDLEADAVYALGGIDGKLQGVKGSMDEMTATAEKSFKQRLTGALRTVIDALTPLGNVLMDIIEPALAKLSTAVEKLSNWFGSLSSTNQKFIVILGLAAAAVGPLLVIIGTLVSSIGAIATAIGSIGLVAAGWIAAIVGIIAVLGLLYAKFEPFRTIVNEVFSFILSYVQIALGAVVAFIQEKLTVLQQFWAENGTQIMQAVTNVFNGIKAVIDFIMPAVLYVIQMVWNSIKGAITGALNVIMGVIKIFAGLFTGDFSKMWEGVKQLFSGALQFIWNYMNLMFVGRIISIIKNFAIGGVNLIVGFAKNITTWFKSMWSSAAGAVSAGVSKVIGFFTSMGRNAGIIFNLLRSTGSSVFNAIRNTISSIASNISSKVVGHFTSLKNGAVNAFNSVKNTASTVFNNVKNFIQNPIRTAVDFVRTQVGKISGFFSGLKISFPKIKLPHFKLKGEFSLKKMSVPTIGIDWYKTGGVFGQASVIGVGEEPGVSEAVIPLKKDVLSGIGQGIAAATDGLRGGGAAPGEQQQIVNHIHVYVGEDEIASYIEPAISEIQGDGVSSKNRNGGVKE